VKRFYPEGRQNQPHYATALHAGRTFQPDAERALLAVVKDAAQPGIVRGTAVTLLPSYLGPSSLPALERAARDPDPLVRLGAASALEALPPRERVRIGMQLLWDKVRAVRVEAVSAFLDVPDAELASEARGAFDRALDEYRLAQRTSAERPESHVNLGIVDQKRGDLKRRAATTTRRSHLRPGSSPPGSTSPTCCGSRGRTTREPRRCARRSRWTRGNAAVHHALGLLLVRQKRGSEALAELAQAAELAPGTPDYAYTYAIGLHSAGRTEDALAALRRASTRNPGARNVLVALVTINRERGAAAEARRYAEKLVAAAPADPAARALRDSLEQN
jgi:tetratricopeptide (TPR) repeat protein